MAEVLCALPRDGGYRVFIDDGFNGTFEGSYCLRADRLTVPVTLCELSPGVPQRHPVGAPGDFVICTFSGCQADAITVRATRLDGRVWPSIRVIDASCKQIGEAKDPNTAELPVSLPATGIYSVVLDDGFNGTFTGEVSLSLTFRTQSNCGCLRTFALEQLAATGCKPVLAKVELMAPAPTGGTPVLLTGLGPVLPPPQITVPAGQTAASFLIPTQAVDAAMDATITAKCGVEELSQPLVVLPVGVASVGVTSLSIRGGDVVQATVSLECSAAPGDILVTLSSSDPAIAFPTAKSIIIPKGSSADGTFTITTRLLTKPTPVTLYATANGRTQGVTLTVTP